jgi:hypothetical protein
VSRRKSAYSAFLGTLPPSAPPSKAAGKPGHAEQPRTTVVEPAAPKGQKKRPRRKKAVGQ